MSGDPGVFYSMDVLKLHLNVLLVHEAIIFQTHWLICSPGYPKRSALMWTC